MVAPIRPDSILTAVCATSACDDDLMSAAAGDISLARSVACT